MPSSRMLRVNEIIYVEGNKKKKITYDVTQLVT